MAEERISLSGVEPISLLGQQDSYLRLIRENSRAKIVARGEEIIITGEEEDVRLLKGLFSSLILQLKEGESLSEGEVLSAMDSLRRAEKEERRQPRKGVVIHCPKGPIRPKSQAQEVYLKVIEDYDIVVSIGPAGTGKTYLAVANAVSSLSGKKTGRIILTRPAVEAGESLGFLPGDFKEKVDPYLRPLYDALYDMLPVDKLRKLLDSGVIEVAPLAYMRGRTLNDSFVILDEAQNTTRMQMKMFLTRLGFNSKTVITGDVTQIDLSPEIPSGLVEIESILSEIEGIKFIYLTERDVVRHPLVTEIIRAYEKIS